MIIRNPSLFTVEIESEKDVIVLETETNEERAKVLTNSQGKNFSTTGKLLNWPGEYEVAGCMFKGVETEEGSLIFQGSIEGVRVMHLGKVQKISDKDLEEIDDTDVLIIPVDTSIRTAQEALKISEKIEPRIVVPVGDLAGQYVELAGASEAVPSPKAVIKDSTLPSDKTDVIYLMN